MPDRSCHGSPNCAALSPSSVRCCAAWAAVGLCALWADALLRAAVTHVSALSVADRCSRATDSAATGLDAITIRSAVTCLWSKLEHVQSLFEESPRSP